MPGAVKNKGILGIKDFIGGKFDHSQPRELKKAAAL
jgi:hypothetical protein